METLKTASSPNLSIIVPGGCNGNCSFCFWKRDPDEVKDVNAYGHMLNKILGGLPGQLTQISITGGEPTISPFFETVLKVIAAHREQFTKVVLTTNGSVPAKSATSDYLKGLVYQLKDIVDYVNVSIHHYNIFYNSSIFDGLWPAINKDENEKLFVRPSVGTIMFLNKLLNKAGISSNANCVLTNTLLNTDYTSENNYLRLSRNIQKENILKYIRSMKDYNFSSVSFRKPHTKTSGIEPHSVEKSFSDYKVVSESSCPVCAVKSQILEGMPVTWKRSVAEPSDELDDLIYELVIHPDGKIYADWSKNIEVIV